MNTIMNTSVSSIQRGMTEMQQSAHTIARFGTVDSAADVGNLGEELVNLKLQKNQVVASTKVIKTADEMLGSLLDIRV